MKRLGDFLNMESFDLALLQEVGRGEARPGGVAAAGFQEPSRLPSSPSSFPPRCGASRTSST